MLKWRKFTFSKQRFPTKVVKDSNSKGRLRIGSKQAHETLINIVGKERADKMVKMHTKTLWRWGELHRTLDTRRNTTND